MKSISALMDEFEASRNVDRDLRVGPSDYGKCPRQIMYRVTGHEPGTQRQTSRAATMGTLFWQGLGEFIAEAYPDAVVEGRVAIPGLGRGGSFDLRWINDGVLVDVKTKNQRGFDRVVSLGEASPEHVGQLETYALAVNRAKVRKPKSGSLRELGAAVGHDPAPTPIEMLTVAYVNRDNGDCHEITWAYDEDTAREKVAWLVEQEEMIDAGVEMPRAPGARLGGFPCDWCPFWRECWQIDDDTVPDTYASKFTTSDPMIEDAIGRYMDANETEAKAKAAKAEARDQLVGIEYAANGFKLSWSGGRTTYEDQIDHDALVAFCVEHKIPVPMTTVEKRTARRISLKRVSS